MEIVKGIIALLIVLAATYVGVDLMIHGEGFVRATLSRDEMIHGLKLYFTGMGLAFFLAGVAYILVGKEENLSTRLVSNKK